MYFHVKVGVVNRFYFSGLRMLSTCETNMENEREGTAIPVEENASVTAELQGNY